jgi:hypothetical protein
MAKCNDCGHVHIGAKQCRVEVPLKNSAGFKLCKCPNQKSAAAGK